MSESTEPPLDTTPARFEDVAALLASRYLLAPHRAAELVMLAASRPAGTGPAQGAELIEFLDGVVRTWMLDGSAAFRPRDV